MGGELTLTQVHNSLLVKERGECERAQESCGKSNTKIKFL